AGDLDRAVGLLHDAIGLVPKTSPSAAGLLGALAAALVDRYRHSRVRTDADGAVQASEAALELLPQGEASPQRWMLLTIRANALLCLYEQADEGELLDHAIDASLEAMASAPPAVPSATDPRLPLVQALTSRFGVTGDPADIAT